MKVNRQKAVEQVLRFEHYPGFPGEDRLPDQEELIRAFQEAATSNKEAVEIGNYFVETLKYCPKPADVHEIAASFAERRRYDWNPTPYNQPGDSNGALDDYLTPEDLAKWRDVMEHGKTKAARDIARVILDRHSPKAEVAHG